jgi:hypothetical protein
MHNIHSTTHDDQIDSGLVMRHEAIDLVARPAADLAVPEPVSMSSDLNERDRFHRAGATVVHGVKIAKMSGKGLRDLDRDLRQAQAEGTTPMALANMERINSIFSQAAGNVVYDFLNNPYQRW